MKKPALTQTFNLGSDQTRLTFTGLNKVLSICLKSSGCISWSELLNSHKKLPSCNGARFTDMQSSWAKQFVSHSISDFTWALWITWFTRILFGTGSLKCITRQSSEINLSCNADNNKPIFYWSNVFQRVCLYHSIVQFFFAVIRLLK